MERLENGLLMLVIGPLVVIVSGVHPFLCGRVMTLRIHVSMCTGLLKISAVILA